MQKKKDYPAFQDSSMDELADILSELITQKNENQGHFEAVESYIENLRTHFYQDSKQFHRRFIRGYESLLEVIKKEKI